MLHSLNSYLHQHNSLCIPGIGKIYIERTPARSDFTNKQILPPGYHYRFDRFIDTPDKNLFAFLARAHNVPDYEAIRWYSDWALEMSQQLKTNSEFSWQGVGTLSRSDGGDIFFQAVAPIDAHLVPVAAHRIVRANTSHTMLVGDREITNLEMTGYLNDGEKRGTQKISWTVYILIAIALSLAILLFFIYTR